MRHISSQNYLNWLENAGKTHLALPCTMTILKEDDDGEINL